jgi:hypothetical protein
MTTKPGTYDFTIYQGATFLRVLTWKDEANALVNLTGYTARMQIRSNKDSADPTVTLTTENGGIALGGAAGTITLTITATDSAAITESEGVYDLELVSSGGVVTRLLQGAVEINKEVTR